MRPATPSLCPLLLEMSPQVRIPALTPYVCMAPDEEFSHEGGVGQHKGQNEISEQECGAAVARSLRRKAPDIPKPHGRTRCRQNEAQPRSKFTACCRHRLPQIDVII